MTTASLPFWTELLGLPDYEVLHCQAETDPRHYHFTVAPKHRVGLCLHCGKVTETVHQTRTRERIKDLPISGYAVELKVRVLQFQCDACGACFTPAIPFLAEAAHATERFLEQAARLVRTSDLANAAAFLGVPERTARPRGVCAKSVSVPVKIRWSTRMSLRPSRASITTSA